MSHRFTISLHGIGHLVSWLIFNRMHPSTPAWYELRKLKYLQIICCWYFYIIAVGWGKSSRSSSRSSTLNILGIHGHVFIKLFGFYLNSIFSLTINFIKKLGFFLFFLCSLNVYTWMLKIGHRSKRLKFPLCKFCIRIRTRGGIYGNIWPEPEGNPKISITSPVLVGKLRKSRLMWYWAIALAAASCALN